MKRAEHRTEGSAPKSQDRRVRKTRALLRHCLAELMKTKQINEITVKELTDMSDLNRGTFYLHYRDVYDLLEQTEEELIGEFNLALNKFEPAELHAHPSLVFTEIFTLIRENQDIVGILMSENGDLKFQNRIKDIVKEKCLKDMISASRMKNQENFMLLLHYFLSGCVGIVQYWLKNGCRETPRELALITEDILREGILKIS